MAMSILVKELAPREIGVLIFDPGWVKTDRGGPHAVSTPKESMGGMRKVFASNAIELSGKFLGHER
jgi:hypothetical protein